MPGARSIVSLIVSLAPRWPDRLALDERDRPLWVSQ
jgi:hypothetical protein